jgi:hypothetical protein
MEALVGFLTSWIDANQERLEAKIDAYQEKMDAYLEEMKDGQTDQACQEVTRAYLKKQERP